MAWSSTKFKVRYNQLAKVYDPGMWLYRLIGFRINTYRRMTVDRLNLQTGDTVIDLGCGTGLNFALLQQEIGKAGRIIGVDISPGMLNQARHRIEKAGWNNVELIEADMSGYYFPADSNAVVATLTLATVDDYDAIIDRAARQLPAGTIIAAFDLQKPKRWPKWLTRLCASLNRPFGVTPDIMHRRPVEAMAKTLTAVSYREVYFGAVIICSGSVSER